MVEEKCGVKSTNKAGGLSGLSRSEVRASREKHGENKLKKTKKRSFLRQFIGNMNDPVIRILLFALLLNLLFLIRGGDIYESIGIGFSVFLATFISTLSEYSSEAAFEKLQGDSRNTLCSLKRDGKLCRIPSSEIVVGDIVILTAGDRIPADCALITGSMTVDQSAMTGENLEVKKSPAPTEYVIESRLTPDEPYALLGGCTVVSGEGIARVCTVGENTFIGGISLEVRGETRESPLKLRLRKLASTISRLGYIAAILVAAAYLTNSFIIDSGHHPGLILLKLSDIRYVAEKLLHALTLGLTVLVVAVPEGLPLMISVVLSANIKKMVRDNVLVRKPVGIEAAGSMNILFTDKTGTLTEGRLSVKEFILGDGSSIEPGNGQKGYKINDDLMLSALFNTSASFDSDGKAIGGNFTDIALTSHAASFRQSFPNVTVLEKLPFDSDKKLSAVRLIHSGKERIFIKGAPENLLPHVSRCLKADGSVIPFNLIRFKNQIKERTAKGGRVLLIAESDKMPGGKISLTLIAAVHLSDKVRAEARGSVGKLKGAGVHVVMVTGDSPETAEAIARECGILSGSVDISLTSTELAKLSDGKLRSLLPRIGVIARALPADKSRLVRVAQEAEMVVGMTGDGINDAPALRRADIGFAMGSGTEVAKEAGDIIILDNDLSSIVKAVLYGRGIFKNIRKFITLQLTMNLAAVGVSMIGPFIGIDAPVTVVQMLWINIIMDTLGGIAFAGEHAGEEYLLEAPKKRDERILNRYMAWQIAVLGGFMIVLDLSFLKLPAFIRLFRYQEGGLYHLTAFFALFIFSSVFCCFCTRSDSLNLFRGLTKNKIFIMIMLFIAVIQIAFIYLGGNVLRTLPLTLSELRSTLLTAMLIFPADLLRKALLRLFGSKNISY